MKFVEELNIKMLEIVNIQMNFTVGDFNFAIISNEVVTRKEQNRSN